VMVRMSVASPFHPIARTTRSGSTPATFDTSRHDAGRCRGGGDRSELRALGHELPTAGLPGDVLPRPPPVASGLQVLGHLLCEHLHQAVAVERAHGAHVERRLAVGLGSRATELCASPADEGNGSL
jgi:hypothetical protein